MVAPSALGLAPDVLWPLAALAVAAVVAALGELLHARRVRRVARLAFGPSARPAPWARAAPHLRVAALSALAWGLATLLLLSPRTHSAGGSRDPEPGEIRHVVLVLDVSPSMQLADAGPKKDQTRMQRARTVLESLFRRLPMERHRVSVIAVYNGAKPVVEDTRDFEVVRNILGDLPLQHAFPSGKTKLFDGLEEAVRLARPWNPRSTTLALVSDGDTVPAKGMPALPASVDEVLVVGVGDPLAGKFIDGRQSRQDVSTLRQIAARLGGAYWNANELHLPSSLVATLGADAAPGAFGRLGRREYALLAAAVGALALALLPLALHHLGTRWRPGTGAPAAARGVESGRPLGRAVRNRAVQGKVARTDVVEGSLSR